MKVVVGMSSNALALLGDGKTKPFMEIVVTVSEPGYELDEESVITKLTRQETYRFFGCPSAIRKMAIALLEQADSAERKYTEAFRPFNPKPQPFC